MGHLGLARYNQCEVIMASNGVCSDTPIDLMILSGIKFPPHATFKLYFKNFHKFLRPSRLPPSEIDIRPEFGFKGDPIGLLYLYSSKALGPTVHQLDAN